MVWSVSPEQCIALEKMDGFPCRRKRLIISSGTISSKRSEDKLI